jgi:branched-chain amino acid transport system substrate-binding protein
MEPKKCQSISRRKFVQTSAGVVAAGTLLGKRAFAAPRPLKIGYVSPETGALAPFGESDAFVVDEIRKLVQGGIQSGGTTRQVELLVRDSQSSPNRAAEVAAELIKSDKIDLMVSAAAPETVNPVADQCEINQMPCVSTDDPWQPYFFGRGGDPAKGFDWTYHFFWGGESVQKVFGEIVTLVPTNKIVGILCGNDPDGNLWSDPQKGAPPTFIAEGFKVVDPGRFLWNTNDFSAQVSFFKKANAEVLFGNMVFPIFSNFWSQAAQQGYKPKIVAISKGLLMPSAIDSLGPRGVDLSTEVWWTSKHPFKSSLTGQSAGQLCDQFEATTKKQWMQALGFRHALYEVALDVFKRAQNPDSAASVIDAVRNTRLNTIVGPVQWLGTPPQYTTIPVKNVCTTPLVGGQWVPGKKWMYDLVVTANKSDPRIAVQRKMVSLPA